MAKIAHNTAASKRVALPVAHAVLVIALVITASATLYLNRTIDSNDDLRFQTLDEQVKDSIAKRTDSQTRLLLDTAGVIGVQPDLTREKFAIYVRHTDFAASYPGLLGIGYSVRILPGQLAAIEAQSRADGLPNFKVHPYQEGQENHAILYLEPEEGVNQRAFGYNMYSEQERRSAMDRARDRAKPTVSAPIKLVQDSSDAPARSVVIYMPVFQGGVVPPPGPQRVAKLQGFAYAPIRGDNLLDKVLSAETQRYLSVRLYDGEPETGTLLDAIESEPAPDGYQPRYKDVYQTTALGRTWTITISTNRQFDRMSDRGILPFVLGIGILASVLLFALSYSQQRARLEAENTAERLRHVADGQQFLAQAGAILSGSLDYEDTLRKVAQLAVPRLADWCAVNMLEPDGTVRGLAVAHANPAKVRLAQMLAQKYPDDPNSGHGTSRAILTGKTELFKEVPDSLLVAAARNEEHLELLRKLGMRSAMIVPLIARDRVLGTISMVWAESGNVYSEEDVAMAEQLAARAALAVDNSRLYRDSLQEVTDRQRAEEAVRTLNAELEHRVEEQTRDLRVSNAELEAFSYSVSHDLRAPLRSVSAFASILREDLGEQLDEESKDHLERLDRAARRMGQLIDSLLQYSRLARREIRTERVDLSALAEAIASELRERYPDRKVDIRVRPGMCVDADPVLLRVVYENLLENSLKFTSHRDMAVIEVGQLDDRDGAFFVRDNGAGFDAQYAGKLFRPFERLHKDSEFPGTGIGLANVRRVIERHGGKVWAEGAIDEGATIYFTLPGVC